MADVSVEFGAKDTGLEQTLKTVQAELTKLESEVKSGELSFDALQQTMRKLAQTEKLEAQLQAMASGMDKAGSAASAAEPKLDALGNEATDMGNKVQGAGQKTSDSAGLFDAGFAKIAAAFTVGNLAAKGFEAIINGVFSAARAVVDGFGQALDLGGRLNELSQRTGETAGNLLILENAFKNSGLAGDQVGQVINKLQNFMQDAANGGDKQTATMNRLGISMEQLAGKTPTQQMEIFASKISAIEDPTQRAATASDVFGEKLGGKLLPLLSEFSPTLEDSRAKVGSLADVMDQNAATFDAAGERIDAVRGKLTAFAAGILSETIPAFDELGRSVEQIDAASLGEEIGSVLNPALRELNSILIDGIREYKEYATVTQAAGAGNYEAANSTGKATGALDLLGTMVASVVGPISDLVNGTTTYIDASNRAAEAAKNGAASIEQVGAAAASVPAPLEEAAVAADSVSTSIQAINNGGAFASINEGATQFNSLLGEGNVALSDMSGSITSQIPLQTEQVALVGELNTSLGEANEKAGEQLTKIEQQIAAEQARNEMIAARQEKSAADYALQLKINQAIAAGNTEEAKRLENQREHSQLTEKIMRDTGMTEGAAGRLAENLMKSKDAADEATKPISKIKTDTGDARKDIATYNSFLDLMQSQQTPEVVKDLSQKSSDARREITAFGDYIGKDLSKMSFPDIAKKLGIDTIGMTGSEQIDAILNYIKNQLPAAQQNVIDQAGAKESVDAVASDIESRKPTMKPQVDATEAKNELESAFRSPVDLAFNAEASIGKIRESLKKEIDVAIQSSKGTEHLSSIDKLVGRIEELVSKISDKLPMQALA